jgi:phytanoyl-CoA hydroxylase
MTVYTEAPRVRTDHERSGPLPSAEVRRFDIDGFSVARELIPPQEVDRLRDEFMAIAARGALPGYFEPQPTDPAKPDPLRTYPRILMPHEFHQLSRDFLVDARITGIVTQLLGEEPICCQTMFYYKPPGARGQWLHQDNFYLRVEPGTCIAAWMAVDQIDRSNGGLEVVPGTHAMEIFCPEEADPDQSFTKEFVPPPPGLEAVAVDMDPGDVLFFNGSLVHGSQPNTTADRFRRSFISHYAPLSTLRKHRTYKAFRLDGTPVELPDAEGGGPCGTDFDDSPGYH